MLLNKNCVYHKIGKDVKFKNSALLLKHKSLLLIEFSFQRIRPQSVCNCCNWDRRWFPKVHRSEAWSPGRL